MSSVRFLFVIGEIDWQHRRFRFSSCKTYVEDPWFLNFNQFLEERLLTQSLLVVELSFDIAIIVLSIGESRRGLIALPNSNFDESWLANLNEKIQMLPFMQVERVIVIEREKHYFLVIYPHWNWEARIVIVAQNELEAMSWRQEEEKSGVGTISRGFRHV